MIGKCVRLDLECRNAYAVSDFGGIACDSHCVCVNTKTEHDAIPFR